MAKIISITNQKGGVGKTTTSVNLTAILADMGQRVLVIDLDPQGNTTSGLGLKAEDKTIYEVLLGRATMKSAVRPTRWDHLSCVASDIRLTGAELELAALDKREYRLKTAIKTIEKDFDFIFIDCPPSLSLLTVNAMAASNSVLIPIQCEYYALEGVTSLMETIQRIKKTVNPRLTTEGVLLTMMDGRTNLSIQVADSVKKHFRKAVFATSIPRSVRLGEAPSHGEPIHIYDGRSTGAMAYRALAGEVLERNGIKTEAK